MLLRRRGWLYIYAISRRYKRHERGPLNRRGVHLGVDKSGEGDVAVNESSGPRMKAEDHNES